MKTIIVAKALCTPARDAVTRTLQPYGVLHTIEHYPDETLSKAMQAVAVTVNDQAAAWTEYLLLRSKQFRLLSTPLDSRNKQWAGQWNGKMPQPWVESGCDPKNPIAAAVDAVTKPIRRQRAQRTARTQRQPRKERY